MNRIVHNISDVHGVDGGSMFLPLGETPGHTLDARIESGEPGADTRMDDIIARFEKLASFCVKSSTYEQEVA